jgi:hypothetical protein
MLTNLTEKSINNSDELSNKQLPQNIIKLVFSMLSTEDLKQLKCIKHTNSLICTTIVNSIEKQKKGNYILNSEAKVKKQEVLLAILNDRCVLTNKRILDLKTGVSTRLEYDSFIHSAYELKDNYLALLRFSCDMLFCKYSNGVISNQIKLPKKCFAVVFQLKSSDILIKYQFKNSLAVIESGTFKEKFILIEKLPAAMKCHLSQLNDGLIITSTLMGAYIWEPVNYYYVKMIIFDSIPQQDFNAKLLVNPEGYVIVYTANLSKRFLSIYDINYTDQLLTTPIEIQEEHCTTTTVIFNPGEFNNDIFDDDDDFSRHIGFLEQLQPTTLNPDIDDFAIRINKSHYQEWTYMLHLEENKHVIRYHKKILLYDFKAECKYLDKFDCGTFEFIFSGIKGNRLAIVTPNNLKILKTLSSFAIIENLTFDFFQPVMLRQYRNEDILIAAEKNVTLWKKDISCFAN